MQDASQTPHSSNQQKSTHQSLKCRKAISLELQHCTCQACRIYAMPGVPLLQTILQSLIQPTYSMELQCGSLSVSFPVGSYKNPDADPHPCQDLKVEARNIVVKLCWLSEPHPAWMSPALPEVLAAVSSQLSMLWCSHSNCGPRHQISTYLPTIPLNKHKQKLREVYNKTIKTDSI